MKSTLIKEFLMMMLAYGLSGFGKTMIKMIFLLNIEKMKGKEWAEEDLKSLLAMLSGYRSPGNKNKVYGYKSSL